MHLNWNFSQHIDLPSQMWSVAITRQLIMILHVLLPYLQKLLYIGSVILDIKIKLVNNLDNNTPQTPHSISVMFGGKYNLLGI